jgi:branched-chain amino acid transport system substrate-binding protein
MVTRLGSLALAAVLFAAPAAAQIKIAYIDPLSGPFANVGEAGLIHFRAIVDKVNASGGVLGGQKLEVVPFDNKGSPQESLIVFKAVTDQGIRFITQGNGSGVAHALVDAVNKHNARNPDRTVLYLNYAAVDPELTNEKCSFWHFRFDANSEQKLEAITSYLARQPAVKKVYLVNQDYAHGHQVARYAEAMLKKKRPDVQIVGNDLHPIGKVKDFAPYVSKIKASGADTVITGNWGNDVTLLVKAAKDAGLPAVFYTFYAGGIGTAPVVGAAGADRMVQITEWHLNQTPNRAEAYALEFNKKQKFGTTFYYLRINNEILMLAKAIEQARSADPKKVALALEGMRFDGDAGEITMRKEDHQLIQPLVLSVFTKAGVPGVKYDLDATGYGFKTLATVAAQDTELGTTCKMERP